MKELYRFRQFLAEGVIKENIDFPELEDEFEGAMDAMVVEPEVYLQDIIDASTEEIVSDDYYEIMNAVEQGVYSKDEAVKLAKSWAKEKLSTLSEGVIKEEDIAEMAYERDSVEDIVKRIKPILANHPQLKKQEDPEQYLIDFVTKRKRFINKNEAPIGKDKFARNISTMPYDKYIKLQFNEYIYSTTP